MYRSTLSGTEELLISVSSGSDDDDGGGGEGEEKEEEGKDEEDDSKNQALANAGFYLNLGWTPLTTQIKYFFHGTEFDQALQCTFLFL